MSVPAQTPDPDFYIYLSFGQSNMEGQGAIETEDQRVDSRFQVFQAVNCSNLSRSKENWYPAVPPLTRCYSGLSPADYFGRTLVENLPDSIRVGIINVSVAGSKIELFDKDKYQDYVESVTADWLLNIINEYDGNPYQYLVNLAQEAQNFGVIKGFLLHQGESNNGDSAWPQKVKTVYDNLINDLNLDPEQTPLLAGEVVHADVGGVVAGMNSIINTLPNTLPNSYVVSSSQCTAASDNLHFDSAGYRELGKRYALKMLEVMEIQAFVNPVGTTELFLEPECAFHGDSWEILKDSLASNDLLVSPKEGFNNYRNASADSSALIILPFKIDTTGYYDVYARLNNPESGGNSLYLKIDDGDFEPILNLTTSGWEWVPVFNKKLEKGDHILTLSYREDGLMLDKLVISNFEEAPMGAGGIASNSCKLTNTEPLELRPAGYQLLPNYPNPFNPTTLIQYELPVASEISLRVINSIGQEVTILVNKVIQSAGLHSVKFDAKGLSSGVYIYQLTTPSGICISRKMLLIK